MLGKKQEAAEYRKLAEQMAAKWKDMAPKATLQAGLTIRRERGVRNITLYGSRSRTASVLAPLARSGISVLSKHQNAFGLPLDNRKLHQAGLDCVGRPRLSEKQSDFIALTDPLLQVHDRGRRHALPLSDWFGRHDGKYRSAFRRVRL